MTDQMFRLPAIRTAELQSGHTPDTWMYLFDYESPSLDGRLGSSHSIDIPFIWGTYGIDSMKEYCGQGEKITRLSDVMMETYIAFARNGDPANNALPAWPRYDSQDRATMRLGEKCFVENAPMDEERRAVINR
jgi:para-nitrobenzyl esterase